jgi:hypothetical protein
MAFRQGVFEAKKKSSVVLQHPAYSTVLRLRYQKNQLKGSNSETVDELHKAMTAVLNNLHMNEF